LNQWLLPLSSGRQPSIWSNKAIVPVASKSVGARAIAIREHRSGKKKSHARIWAINATEVKRQFERVTRLSRKYAGEQVEFDLSFDPDNLVPDADQVNDEIQTRELILKSMNATGHFRAELERQGCVSVALPSGFNPRLNNQQRVFLVNCAEELRFGESLNKMMKQPSTEWCRCFDIAIDAVSDIEQRLFQMNIHEQTLFPDMEGLAGFIRQKMRLHYY
jgi:hypothetical protein